MVLWGGVDVKHIISADKDAVKVDIDALLRLHETNGGLIAGSSHSIAVGSDYDTYMYMMDLLNSYNARKV